MRVIRKRAASFPRSWRPPMIIPAAWPQVLDFFGKPLVIEPSAGQLSGDAGLLPVRQFDQRIGLTQAFAEALDDPRDPDLTEHTFLEMVRSRVYGILAWPGVALHFRGDCAFGVPAM